MKKETEKKYVKFYNLAGKASFENWNSVKKSTMCGCYYCGHIFPSSEVTDDDWVPDLHGRTVVCPHCGIDAVIGDESGIPIQKDVLDELYERWFGSNDDDETPDCG
ncbi:MAG: cytoplasmic protein [Bacteroidales bacterium]|nr:cytoplasmic protein [Bacteroidales bacterium]